MHERFGVSVQRVANDAESAERAFHFGYNSVVRQHIDAEFGDGAFAAVVDQTSRTRMPNLLSPPLYWFGAADLDDVDLDDVDKADTAFAGGRTGAAVAAIYFIAAYTVPIIAWIPRISIFAIPISAVVAPIFAVFGFAAGVIAAGLPNVWFATSVGVLFFAGIPALVPFPLLAVCWLIPLGATVGGLSWWREGQHDTSSLGFSINQCIWCIVYVSLVASSFAVILAELRDATIVLT